MIDFQDVTVSFNGQKTLSNITIHIARGEFLCLVGESGVGKTTFLRLIYFDIFPDHGVVEVGEYTSATIRKREIPNVRRSLGIVFQDFKLLEDRNVYENVAFPLQVTASKKADIGSRTLRVLADVGLSHKRSNMPSELSGGEQQRVVIARALVNVPQAILADEPTANLDATTTNEILSLLREINAKGTAIILATHDHELARRSGGRIVHLVDGVLREDKPA